MRPLEWEESLLGQINAEREALLRVARAGKVVIAKDYDWSDTSSIVAFNELYEALKEVEHLL